MYEPSCPAFEKFKWDSFTSSGKIWMARDIYEEKYTLSQSIMEKIFACSLCGNCTVQCQQEIGDHALDIFEALREECVEANLQIPAHRIFEENIEKFNNPYGEQHSNRWTGIAQKFFREKADILFFVGCTTALRNKSLFQAILNLLDVLGVDFTLSKDEWCCGSPLLTTGQRKSARMLAEHNAKLINKLRVKKVITACAGCFRTLHSQYSEKFPNLASFSDVPILHISQFLDKLISQKQFFHPKKKSINVTYHDPCHLGRHAGVFREPRSVLSKLRGVKLFELLRNRKNSWCCGAGAGVKSGFKDWAIEISEKRLNEALSLEKRKGIRLDYLVSTCPFCERNLSDARRSLAEKGDIEDGHLEVIDLTQLLDSLSMKS